MATTAERTRFDDPALNEALRQLRRVDNVTNLRFLLFDWTCIAATVAATVWFHQHRASWGLAWAWNMPVFTVAVILIGGLQHRLSGLAHEASHFSLLRNKFANDLVADVFCMFPIFSTIHFYRLFHLAHHQYTNDRERDPDLVNLGPGKRVDDFPMPRLRAIVNIYLRALVFPFSFLLYQWEYVYINSLGKGGNVYMKRTPGGDGETPWLRVGTLLGIAFVFGFSAALWRITLAGRPDLIPIAALAAIVVSAVGTRLLPERYFFQSPLRQAYSPRLAGFFRLTFYTVVFAILARLRAATAGQSAVYFLMLWHVPLSTTFMFFMLLRDIYQHTNADEGRLTNSRVFFVDGFTRWAVFVHGQDMHVPHHLFPAIPHYHLPKLHSLLKSTHDDYATHVVECRGTFANDGDAPTILDVLTQRRDDTPH